LYVANPLKLRGIAGNTRKTKGLRSVRTRAPVQGYQPMTKKENEQSPFAAGIQAGFADGSDFGIARARAILKREVG